MNSFLVIPAIDLMNGHAVRLRQGRADEKTVYTDDPVEVAERWEAAGAKRIHVVDLDGAFGGRPRNYSTIMNIRRAVSCELELGGGLRTAEAVGQLLEDGVDYAILGTIAVENEALFDQLLAHHGERLIAGIDAKDGIVATRGWTEEVGTLQAVELARGMIEKGCPRIIYTDIATDGMMKGPNLERLREMASLPGIEITASGGVTEPRDLEQIQGLGMESIAGAIVGRALYEGTIDLVEAIGEFQHA